MSLRAAACAISAYAEGAIASPWSWSAYLVVRVAMWWLMPEGLITLILSDFSNLALLLMAVSQARRSAKQERQLDELARVDPRIDDKAIAEGVA